MRWSLVSVPSWDEGVVLYSPYINQSLGRGYSRKGVRPWVRWPPINWGFPWKRLPARALIRSSFLKQDLIDTSQGSLHTSWEISREHYPAEPSQPIESQEVTIFVIPNNLGFGNEFVKHSRIGRRESGTRTELWRTSLLKGQREEEPVETQRRSYSESRR